MESCQQSYSACSVHFLVGRSRDGDRKRALVSGLRSNHMKHAVVFGDGGSAYIVFKVHPL